MEYNKLPATYAQSSIIHGFYLTEYNIDNKINQKIYKVYNFI